MFSKQATTNIGTNVFLGVLASTGVVLRLLARRRKHASLVLNDYTIFIALIAVYGLTATAIFAAIRDAWGGVLLNANADPSTVLQKMKQRSKLLYADTILFYLAFFFIKISILLFLKQIFVVRWFKAAVHALLAVTSMWFLAAEITHIFADNPIQNWWETPVSIASQRYSYFDLVLAISAIDVFLDLLIWCLPLIVIRSLHLNKARKVSLIAIFCLGFFCVATSIIRLYYCIVLRGIARGEYPNTSQASAEFSADVLFANNLWGHIEAGVSVFTACLPLLGPLIRDSKSLSKLKSSIMSITKTTSSDDANLETVERKSWERRDTRDNDNVRGIGEEAVFQHYGIAVGPK